MRIVKRLQEKEQFINQIVYLMECSCGCQFELNDTYETNCKLYPDVRYPNTKNVVAICPECNDADSDEVLQLGICG